MSYSLWPHGLLHVRFLCPPPSPKVWSNPCPLNWWSNHFIFCNPLLLLPQCFPASGSFPMNQLFTSGGQSFSFSFSPSSEHSGLISFKTDWFHLFAVQRTLKSLLQQHIWKASILQCPAFFMDQLWPWSIHTGPSPLLRPPGRITSCGLQSQDSWRGRQMIQRPVRATPTVTILSPPCSSPLMGLNLLAEYANKSAWSLDSVMDRRHGIFPSDASAFSLWLAGSARQSHAIWVPRPQQ